MLPDPAVEHARARQRLTASTLLLTRREWAQMGSEFDTSWAKIGPRITLLTASAQLGAARAGAAYVPAVLAELDQDVSPLAEVDPRAFAGIASDGRPLDSLLYGGVTTAKSAAQGLVTTEGSTTTYTRGASSQAALAAGGRWLDMAIHTAVADASRGAAGVAITARPGIGFIRVVNPPCCPRCAALAGKWFRFNAGFDRHPRCDCSALACGETGAKGLTQAPQPDQITGLTIGDRKALDEGADLNQVLNAKRGLQGGMTTAEGVSRQGVYGGFVRSSDGSITRRARGTANPQRLTPNGINRLAKGDRDWAVKMLRQFGYLL